MKRTAKANIHKRKKKTFSSHHHPRDSQPRSNVLCFHSIALSIIAIILNAINTAFLGDCHGTNGYEAIIIESFNIQFTNSNIHPEGTYFPGAAPGRASDVSVGFFEQRRRRHGWEGILLPPSCQADESLLLIFCFLFWTMAAVVPESANCHTLPRSPEVL